MAFLFDTDAISEVLRRRPSERYVAWLRAVPRAEQFTSAVVVGELFKGAYRSPDAPRHLRNIETRVLPVLTAATAVHHDLELVTGNLRHFRRISGLRFNTILEEARRG